MKFFSIFLICFLISVVSCAHLVRRQTNANNMDIQSLLQELEKANININEVSKTVNDDRNVGSGKSDTPVRDSLSRLFTSFQQFASAYIGVLTSVGKTIGLPTIPIGGVQFLESPPIDGPIGIKQIRETIQQFQDSAQEVRKSVSNLVTREGPVDNLVLLNEMSKFVRLWSQQIQEITEQVSERLTRTFGGLQTEPKRQTFQERLRELWQNMTKVFEDAINNISNQVNRIVNRPSTAETNNLVEFRQEQKQNQLNLLNDFKKLLENIQKRVKTLTDQLDNLLTGNKTDQELPAEHKKPEGTL